MRPDETVLRQFAVNGKVEPLPQGENRTFRVGNIILKYLNQDSENYAVWIANLFSQIKEDGFRISKPIKNTSNKWITAEGWSAWEYLEGNHEYKEHVRQSIKAINSFHKAVKDVEEPEFMKKTDSPYIRADKYAWGEKPLKIHPELRNLVESLYEIRRPVESLENQLIHGDLNPENILVSDLFPPAIIDIAPYWRPAEFALAVYAYWIIAFRGEIELFNYFSNVKEFNQMLVRAGIRMLLIMSEFNTIHELEKYRKATQIILKRL